MFWVRDGRIIRSQCYGPGAAAAAGMPGLDGNIIDGVRVLSERATTAAAVGNN